MEWAGRLGQGSRYALQRGPGVTTALTVQLPLLKARCVYVTGQEPPQPCRAAVSPLTAARARAQDLAICVHGTTKVTPEQYLNTIPFMDAVREDFERSFSTARL